MSEMVERVAKNICRRRQERWGYTETVPDYVESHWQECMPDARAAIEAMRLPTEPMIKEGWRLLQGNLRPDEIFPYMIDEALK